MSDEGPPTVTVYKDGGYDRRRIAGLLGTGTTVLLLLLVAGLSLGMVGATLGVGIGGFSADFGTLQTEEGGSIYPVLDTVSECDNAPQLAANLHGEVKIDGNFGFFKDVPVPGGTESVRVNVVADEMDDDQELVAENVSLRFTSIEADNLVLGGNGAEKVDIAELPSDGETEAAEDAYADSDARIESTQDLRGIADFGINVPEGGTMNIKDGAALAHNVAFESLSPTGVDVFVTVEDNRTFLERQGISQAASPEEELDCQDIAQRANTETDLLGYPEHPERAEPAEPGEPGEPAEPADPPTTAEAG